MNRVPRLFAILAWLTAGFVVLLPIPAAAQNARHIEASLAFETRSPSPGENVTIAIRMVPEAGWHGYWSNPGEVGLPVEARWQTPSGVSVSPLRHPAPHLLNVQGIASYVHEGPFTLLATMQVPEGLSRGAALPVSVALNWLVCSDTLCVPESATLSADLTVGDGAPDPAGARIVAAGQRAMPRALQNTRYWRDGKDWVFSFPISAGSASHLFPVGEGWFEAAARQRSSSANGRELIRVAASGDAPSGTFRGVLASGSGSHAVAASRATPPADAELAAPSVESDASETGSMVTSDLDFGTRATSVQTEAVVMQTAVDSPRPPAGVSGDVIRVALMGALVGGLLLNLMPCVFPILSLKALSLVKSGAGKRAARIEGLGYAGGAIASALVLGGLLIGLRALGMEIGWSFQLQSPGVILVLLVLTGIRSFLSQHPRSALRARLRWPPVRGRRGSATGRPVH